MEINALSDVTLSTLIVKQVAISLYLFWESTLGLVLFPKRLAPSPGDTISLTVAML